MVMKPIDLYTLKKKLWRENEVTKNMSENFKI